MSQPLHLPQQLVPKSLSSLTPTKGIGAISITERSPDKKDAIKTLNPLNFFDKQFKTLRLGDDSIDNRLGLHICFNDLQIYDKSVSCTFCGKPTVYQGGFEEGVTIAFGPYGTGKSTLCTQLALIGLNSGMKVKYYDTENSLRLPRILQLYRGMGMNFPISKMKDVFFPITKVDFEAFMKDVLFTIDNEKPDLLIIDSLSLIIDDFLRDREDSSVGGTQGKKGYKIWGQRRVLASEMQRLSIENKTICVVTAQLKSKIGRNEGRDESINIQDQVAFNLGDAFAHDAKTHLWLGYFRQKGSIFRAMALTKHRFMPTILNFSDITERGLIRYNIVEKGIVST